MTTPLRRITAALAAGTALLGVAGCSSGQDAASASAEATVTTTVTATVTATPTNPTGQVLSLGQTSHYKWGNVTALKADQDVPVSDHQLPNVKTWMGVLVRTCVTGKDGRKPITLGWDAWAVADKNGGQYDPFAWTGTDYPQPTYPMGRAIPIGQCVKGWIVFNKPAGVHPVKAFYGPSGGDPVVWSLKR